MPSPMPWAPNSSTCRQRPLRSGRCCREPTSCRTRHEIHDINGGLKMYAFTFNQPRTVRQAANILAKDEDAKLLAGGHTLLPTMKLRLAKPSQIVEMGLIEGLSGIEQSGRSLTIGAMTKHHEVNDSPVV